jgi:hypothetical protein
MSPRLDRPPFLHQQYLVTQAKSYLGLRLSNSNCYANRANASGQIWRSDQAKFWATPVDITDILAFIGIDVHGHGARFAQGGAVLGAMAPGLFLQIAI